MKIEFIKIRNSTPWHLPTNDGDRLLCEQTYLPWTGLVVAVILSDHYPKPMCNTCRLKAEIKLLKETTFATYNY